VKVPVAVALAATFLLAAAPAQLDSLVVLNRYEATLTALKPPPVMIFSYTVSQAGTTDIEQRHRIYRSGQNVRDETVAVDGVGLKTKVVRIVQRVDHYAIDRTAPRSSVYTILFVRPIKNGNRIDYEYEATPTNGNTSGYVVDHFVIDGMHMLPSMVHFRTDSSGASGAGDIEYGAVDGYWVPLSASVTATVDGKPARERIVWSEYRFPPSLPPATFSTPKPLPSETLPPI
jgi:hypothetical protein